MRWPPYRHVFFDCDSTLTAVEGIDVLAQNAGKGWRIKVLTDAAMNGELDLEQVYGKRLAAIRPTRSQVTAIRQVYKNNIVADAQAVISALRYLGHQVYIISGGLLEPVREFGLFLGVEPEHIRAVGVEYDQLSGDWWLQAEEEHWEGATRYMTYGEGDLTVSDGKARIVRELLGDQSGLSLLIGDGNSDLLAGGAVDLFVGFGGVVSRQRVRQEAAAFIQAPTLAPLLSIASGPAAIRLLKGTPHFPVIKRANQLVAEGAIVFQDEHLKSKFFQAYQAVSSRSG
jgi:phosphoserine phosphatase